MQFIHDILNMVINMYVVINKKKIKLNECTNFWQRFKGFMFRLEPIKEGLRFPKCRSIHTYFLFQNIDIIMTDKDNKIIKLYPNFGSEKIIYPKRKVYYTYELPVGSINNLKIGDTLKVID